MKMDGILWAVGLGIVGSIIYDMFIKKLLAPKPT